MNVIKELQKKLMFQSKQDESIEFKDMEEGKVYFIPKTRLNLAKDANVFEQEPEKVLKIVSNMKKYGYDNSQIIILNQDGKPIDGLSKSLAAMQCENVYLVPVMIKRFDSPANERLYQYHLQLSRRNLDPTQRFICFCKKEELLKNGEIEHLTDEQLAAELQTSPRNVQKMREIKRKISPSDMQNILDGKVTVNQCYKNLKEAEKAKSGKTSTKQHAKNFHLESFRLGVCYAMLEYLKGRYASQILNSRFMKLNITEYSLSEAEKETLRKLADTSSEVSNGENRT